MPEAFQAAERWRAGAEEQTSDFAPVQAFLRMLMESRAGVFDRPTASPLPALHFHTDRLGQLDAHVGLARRFPAWTLTTRAGSHY